MELLPQKFVQQNVAKIYHSLFAHDDAYRDPFQARIKHKLLLFYYSYGLHQEEPWLDPVDLAMQEQPWLKPVVRTMQELGEKGFYLSVFTLEGSDHWYVPVEEAGTFYESTFPRENVIYSLTGQWGIIGSDEQHGIAGGNAFFYQAFLAATSDWDERLEMFLTYWKNLYLRDNEVKIDWLPTLLTHIYGPVKMQSLLRKMDLDWLIKPD